MRCAAHSFTNAAQTSESGHTLLCHQLHTGRLIRRKHHISSDRQVVRCAIINLAKEAGGRHIELSLRASVINKGLSLSQLTKGSGVYGSVASAEDHGYVVTLGLDGVTAFLPKKDAPESGLQPGQPIETVIQASPFFWLCAGK